MRYILLKSDDIDNFNQEITNKLNEGWKLHGNSFSYELDGKVFFTQAVIKDIAIPSEFVYDNSVEQILASINA